MKIQDILKKQGEIYKNLTSNKTIQKTNEIIEKPPKLVLYEDYKILEQEYKAMTGLEEVFGRKPVIVNEPTLVNVFEISIENNKITYLKLSFEILSEIPEQINNLTNLEILSLYYDYITKIENLHKLTNLKRLYLGGNEIAEIKGLDKLQNLQEIDLRGNKITKIRGLDNLTNLETLRLSENQIGDTTKNKKQAKILKERGISVIM